MKMLMENWNQFLNEADEDKDKTVDLKKKLEYLKKELEKKTGLEPAAVDDAVEDAEKGRYVMGLHATETLEEAKMKIPRLGDVLTGVAVVTFVKAVMKGYEVAQQMGATSEGVAETVRVASLPGMGGAIALAAAGLAFELATEKPKKKNPYKNPYEPTKRMQEEVEEMSDDEKETADFYDADEMSLRDLMDQLDEDTLFNALKSWAEGEEKDEEDLRMHLEKRLSEASEKKLTKSQKKRKEKNVKGMKKNKKNFKKLYGKNAENVMHATATKMAKEEK